MEKFNNLLDGIDPVCREKLIMGTSFALSFVSNERRNMVLQRSEDGIYRLRDDFPTRLDRQPRERNVVNRYTPFFTRREVNRKRKKLKGNWTTAAVPAANQPSVSSASTDPNQDQNQVAQTTLGRTQTRSMTNTTTFPVPDQNPRTRTRSRTRLPVPDATLSPDQNPIATPQTTHSTITVPAANQPRVSSASTDPNQDHNQVAQTTLGRTQNLVDTAPASGSHAHATNTATLPAPNHPGNHGTPLAVEDDGNGIHVVAHRAPRTSLPVPDATLTPDQNPIAQTQTTHSAITATMPAPNNPGNRGTSLAVEDDCDALGVHVPRTRSRTNLAIPNQNLVDTAPASGSHAHATNTATMPAPNHPGNHGTPLAVEDDGNGNLRPRTRTTLPVPGQVDPDQNLVDPDQNLVEHIANHSGNSGTRFVAEETHPVVDPDQNMPGNSGTPFVAEETEPMDCTQGPTAFQHESIEVEDGDGAPHDGNLRPRTRTTLPVPGQVDPDQNLVDPDQNLVEHIANHSGNSGTRFVAEETHPVVDPDQNMPGNSGTPFVAEETEPMDCTQGPTAFQHESIEVEDGDGAPHDGRDSFSGSEIIMALIPSVGTAYSIPYILHADIADLSFEDFRRRVNQAMGVPHDYNGWGYYDSQHTLHWVNDDESYEDMWDGTVPNDLANGYHLLLIADEEQQHDYHLALTHLLNKITEDECRDRVFNAINFVLSASRTKRELVVLQEDGGSRYLIRSRA
ncbi:hypothetical protein QL285_013446 [Trifolium repens]|nr:hypothetical protein QL285_013446 [Trifolium repens]